VSDYSLWSRPTLQHAEGPSNNFEIIPSWIVLSNLGSCYRIGTAGILMQRLSQDAGTILTHMRSLHADTGDYVLVDVFVSLLDDNEDRVCLALDELIKLRLAVVTPDKDALAMTKAGTSFQTNE